ncbi:MAG TPA: aldehyde ferredoxin oxidoreductase family protein [Thermodesulfobacteriota bacterium]|nr:aldehyde ferredoxin oxidoreductase family protein [Thermodesulfobacteriota bacterium]
MENKKANGYNGRVLRVNLTEGRISVEEPPADHYQRYLGGRGFIASRLLKEVPAGADPLGLENRLIFALGPLTGLPLPGAARNSVGAKSPQTGGFGESEGGGFFGPELKKAGFDEIIVEGKAASPVYLWVKDGAAELKDAGHLWGKEVAPTHFALQEELGDRLVRTAVIGPGGERLIPFASVANDITHVAGRTGMGAVMGSKNLKAIAVRGHGEVAAANEAAVRELGSWMAKNFKERTQIWKYGTGLPMEASSIAGAVPTTNFRDGSFADVKKIAAPAVCDQFRIEMYGCYACPLRCKKRVKFDEPYPVDPIYGGPEYETLGAFGTNCGVADAKAICKAHEICNRAGIDTITAGGTIAFAMECFEKGFLTTKDTEGLELAFGNAEAMLKALERMVEKRGFGAFLAEGSRIAAQKIGRGAEEFAVHVKGVEIPMHDPRCKQGLGLHYAVNPAGADHCSGMHDQLMLKGADFEEWGAIDINEPIPVTEMSPRKARLTYQYGAWRHLSNYLLMCVFVPYQKKEIVKLVEAATDWPMSYWRLMKTVERGITLGKIFNLREGLTEKDDVLPKRLATSQKGGNLEGVIVDPEKLSDAREVYYEMLGWSREGVPRRARLVELDIDWAAAHLPRK